MTSTPNGKVDDAMHYRGYVSHYIISVTMPIDVPRPMTIKRVSGLMNKCKDLMALEDDQAWVDMDGIPLHLHPP